MDETDEKPAGKEPTLAVPVSLYLELVRLYKRNPPELSNSKFWLEADRRERIAYRKLQHWRTGK